MYLRESRQKRADGSILTHLQLAENVWDSDKQRAQVKILYNCGRADEPESTERLRRLARSILRRCAPEEIVAENPSWQVVNDWPYGDLYVLEQLWRRLGIGESSRKSAAHGSSTSTWSGRCLRWWPIAPARHRRSCTATSSGSRKRCIWRAQPGSSCSTCTGRWTSWRRTRRRSRRRSTSGWRIF